MSVEFLESLQNEFSSRKANPLQKKSWERFLSLGLPTKRKETYQYIRTRKLLDTYSLEHPSSLSKCEQAALVFVNGVYREELSTLPDGDIIASPLSKAMKSYSAFLNNQWTQSLKEENDPFAALNGALHKEGIFLYIPPNTLIEKPIHILHIIDTDSPLLTQPRCHIYAGTNAEATFLFQSIHPDGVKQGSNQVIEFTADENAHLEFYHIDNYPCKDSWFMNAIRGQLKKNSSFKSLCTTMGSATTRFDYRISLNGENASADLQGLNMLQAQNESHTNVLIKHRAPLCHSNQLFKTVLDDSSRSSFEGKIYVEPIAQQTKAYQLNSNLILDDRASTSCKPNLEIFADDVRASHGATMGQLDPEQIFYLRARGLTELQAKGLLIKGFCKEIIDEIPIKSLREQLLRQTDAMWSC